MNPLNGIDEALIRLRHLWTAPVAVEDPDLGRVEMSTILIVDCLRRAGGQTVAELADDLDVAHSTASRLITRAEQIGAVVRAPDHHDQRRVTVQLTSAGARLATAALDYRLSVLRTATADWTDAELTTFAQLLTRFADRREPA